MLDGLHKAANQRGEENEENCTSIYCLFKVHLDLCSESNNRTCSEPMVLIVYKQPNNWTFIQLETQLERCGDNILSR